MAADDAVTRIVFDASGAKKGADDFKTAAQQVISSNQAVEQSETKTTATVVDAARKQTAARKDAVASQGAKAAVASQGGNGEVAAAAAANDVLATSTDRIVTSLAKQQQILTAVTRAVDPFGAALQKAQKNVDDLNKVIMAGGPNAAQATGLLAAAQQKVADAQKAVSLAANDNSTALGKAGKAAHDAAEAHQALSTQGQEAFHILRSVTEQAIIGAPPLQILGQHISQLSYAASGPGGLTSAFGSVIGILAKFITPTTAIVAAIVAVAGGIALLVNRAAQTEQSLRQFGVGAATLGTASLASAQDLLKFERQLRDSGVAAADARKAIDALRLSPVINPQAIPQITDLAHRLSALADDGSHTVEWTDKLKAALEGGLDPTLKLAQSFGVLRDGEAAHFTEAARLTGSLQQQQAVFELLRSRIAPLKDSFSDAKNATTGFAASWKDFLDKASDSKGIQAVFAATLFLAKGIVDTISGIVTVIEGAIKGIGDLYQLAADKIDQLKAKLPAAMLGQSAGAPPLYGNVSQLPVGTNLPPGGDQRVAGAGVGILPATAAPPPLGVTYAPNASITDTAAGFLGQGAANPQLRQFIQQASSLDPATAAWCAAFANAVLARKGIPGIGSNIATDFLNYGTGVAAGDLQRGDLAVIANGRGAGQTGGHVGFATGEIRTAGGQTQIQVLSGNTGSNQVGLSYYNAGDVTLRRAPTVSGPAAPNPAVATTAAGATPQIFGVTPGSIDEQTKALKEREAEIARNLSADKLVGVEQEAKIVRDRAEAEAAKLPLDAKHQNLIVEAQVAEVYERNAIAIDKAIKAQDFETAGIQKSTAAYGQSEAAGLAAEAQQKAAIETYNRYGTVVGKNAEIQQATITALKQQAAAARLAGEQQIAATDPVLDRQQKVADAALKGAAAENDAKLAAQASAQTHDSLNKAMAANLVALQSGSAAEIEYTASLVKDAKAQTEVALAQAKRNAVQQESIALGHELQQGRDDTQILQLELSLVGQTSEEVGRQVTILRAKQEFVEKFPNLAKLETDEARATYQAFLDQKTAVADLTVKLAEAQAAQSNLNGAISNIAGTIDSTLTTAIEDAFDGKKIDDWGARIKSVLKNIVTQLADALFIKPLLGSLASALGFPQVGQQLGSFGGLGALFGGSTTNTANTQNVENVVVNEGGAQVANETSANPFLVPGTSTPLAGASTSSTFSFGTVASGASLASSSGLFGGSGGLFGAGAGGISGFLNNNIGGSLGFATPLSQGDIAATIANPADAAGVTGVTEGSLFGSTTLTSALGGVGLGFGAGELANSLIGGNSTNGTIGSAGGAIAGALIGSIIPGIGTLIGGLVGGLLGGAGGGLLGPAKSTFSSGNFVNLGTGGISGFQSSGNTQNNSTVNSISSAVAQFSKDLATSLKGTGASFAGGALNVQAGTDGVKASYAGPLGNITQKFSDAQSAISGIEQAILQNLSNVTGTLKTVLAHVTDPSQLAAAVAFAKTYDAIKTAADSAFSSVESASNSIGPFAQALDQINTLFSGLTDQATQFGLSLDPINAALAEATKRLKADFGTTLDQALATTQGTVDFVDQLAAVSKQFAANTRDASAIGLGGDATTAAKIAQLEVQQAQAVLSPLTATQLQKVVDELGQSNPEIAAMAQAILDTGTAATDATAALVNLATGIQGIAALAKSLKDGQLAGLTPAAQVTASTADYQAALAAATAAGTMVSGTQLAVLATTAQAALAASIAAYGQGPQTADLRKQITAALPAVQANATTEASGTGTVTNAAVSAAQTAVAAAAVGGSASQGTPGITRSAADYVAGTATQAEIDDVVKAVNSGEITRTADIVTASGSYLGNPAGTPGITQMLAAVNAGGGNPAEIQAVRKALQTGEITAPLTAVGHAVLGFAAGTSMTPPGAILVGERGPEWMLPKAGSWTQVGKRGPEIIDQPGGAKILPFPQRPPRKPVAAFADGTLDTAAQAVGGISTVSGTLGGPTITSVASDALGLSGSVGGIVDSLGGTLGFASSAGEGAVFGALTLTDALAGAGIGSLVGGLLNSLVGGHSLGGSIGSNIGAIGGSVIGAIVGGPIGAILGGLLGGIGGGLFGGLFGPKPPNNASGGTIDLATGQISDVRSGGVAKSDRTVAEIGLPVALFSQMIQQATGGTIAGALNIQDGTRDGIIAAYAGPLGKITAKFGSAAEATRQLELSIAQNLSGLTPPVHDALTSVTDPAQFTSVLASVGVTFPPGTASATAPAAADPTAAAAAAPVDFGPGTPGITQMAADYVAGIATLDEVAAVVAAVNSGEITRTAAIVNASGFYLGNPYGTPGITQMVAAYTAGTASPEEIQAVRTAAQTHELANLPAPPPQPEAGPAFAAGAAGTPPGRILVGERGPEWMLPKAGAWTKVGMGGPEIIDQPGGAKILPFPQIPAFADGTDLPEMPARLPSPGRMLAQHAARDDGSNIVAELKAMRDELAALRKQTQGGQAQAAGDAKTGNAHLAEINRKSGTGLVEPQRLKVA